jgi:hypothetical protein
MVFKLAFHITRTQRSGELVMFCTLMVFKLCISHTRTQEVESQKVENFQICIFTIVESPSIGFMDMLLSN